MHLIRSQSCLSTFGMSLTGAIQILQCICIYKHPSLFKTIIFNCLQTNMFKFVTSVLLIELIMLTHTCGFFCVKALDRMKITKLSDSMRSDINKDFMNHEQQQQPNRAPTNGRSRPHSMDSVMYEKLLGAERSDRSVTYVDNVSSYPRLV